MEAKTPETEKGKEPKMVSAEKKSALLMGFGAFAVVLGAIALVYWPALFFSQLKKMMILTNVSTSFSVWRETPVPMYLECFMFNITNVDEILAGRDVKLKVEQMGPYVFQEQHSKENITWHNENSTVAFFNERWWYFQPDMSNGSLSDEVTSINPIIATVAYLMRGESLFMRLAVNAFLHSVHEHMFITANVSSWLFDGIEDPVLDIAQEFPNITLNIPYDKFGWFYARNGSMEYDGAFLMNTGASDFSQLGNVEMWRHSNRTLYRDECGEVRGSTGELWAPELGQPEVTIFAPDICTYLILNKNKDVRIEGIDGVEYAANDSVFDNGYRYPRMACYCAEARDAECVPAGALNVSACRFGAPAFVSLPHMLHSDPYYPSKIDGLAPTDAHNFRLALEMFTGMPLAVSAQLQVNLLVRRVSMITIVNRLPDPDTLVPMFWFRQEMTVTPEYARLAKFALNLRYGVPYGMYALTIIGLLLLVAGIFVLLRKLLKPTDEPILDDSSHEESSHVEGSSPMEGASTEQR